MKIKKFAAICILTCAVLSPSLVLAQDAGKAVVAESGEGIGWICKTSDTIYDCVPRLYDFALGIAGIIAVGVLVAAGYLRMTSGGDGKQLTTAKEMGGAVAAGLLLLLTAYILLRFLNPQLVEINRNPGQISTNTQGGWQSAGTTNSGTPANAGQGFVLVSPSSRNVTAARGENLVFEVRLQQPSSRLNRVVFTAQPGGVQSTLTSAPFRYSVNTTQIGTTLVSAQAFDDAGNSIATTQLSVNVVSQIPLAPKPISITFPPNNTYVRGSAEIRTNVPDGATGIKSVKFDVFETEGIDSIIYTNTSTGPSYKTTWTVGNQPNGRYRARATATYSDNSTSQAEITLLLQN